MNDWMDKIMRKVTENLPAILTGVGVVVGLSTVCYSVYAGGKIKEVVDNEELDTKSKCKQVVKHSAPIIVGAAVATTCHIVAHKESASRLAAAVTLYGATKLDTDKVKEEAQKIIGNGKEKETKKCRVVEPMHNVNGKIRIRDDVTGYEFETTMNDFWSALNTVNAIAETEVETIGNFYDELLGKDYACADTHDMIVFGYNTGVESLRPEFSAIMNDDMTLSYAITYPHDTM